MCLASKSSGSLTRLLVISFIKIYLLEPTYRRANNASSLAEACSSACMSFITLKEF